MGAGNQVVKNATKDSTRAAAGNHRAKSVLQDSTRAAAGNHRVDRVPLDCIKMGAGNQVVKNATKGIRVHEAAPIAIAVQKVDI